MERCVWLHMDNLEADIPAAWFSWLYKFDPIRCMCMPAQSIDLCDKVTIIFRLLDRFEYQCNQKYMFIYFYPIRQVVLASTDRSSSPGASYIPKTTSPGNHKVLIGTFKSKVIFFQKIVHSLQLEDSMTR